MSMCAVLSTPRPLVTLKSPVGAWGTSRCVLSTPKGWRIAVPHPSRSPRAAGTAASGLPAKVYGSLGSAVACIW